jgi:hypothetical protein
VATQNLQILGYTKRSSSRPQRYLSWATPWVPKDSSSRVGIKERNYVLEDISKMFEIYLQKCPYHLIWLKQSIAFIV